MTAPPRNVHELFSVKVDNVNYDSRDFFDVKNELKDKFSKYGEVADVHLPRDKNFVFVRYADEREAEDAVEGMDGKEMYGGEIKCMMATKPKRAKDDYNNNYNKGSSYGDRRSGRSRSHRRRDDSRDRRGGRRGRRDDSRRRRDDSRKRR
mmetsp:Transcript_68930/g.109384  ORF Transcript_68930/g.109384 Transcript_68930/m.109384 type:complete len:150 (-) Transcript_68930:140-589(-)